MAFIIGPHFLNRYEYCGSDPHAGDGLAISKTDSGMCGAVYCILLCPLLRASGFCHWCFQIHRTDFEIMVPASGLPGDAAAHQYLLYQTVPQLYAGV